jgi:DNA-binding transcriptional LysR family regulator
MILLQVISQAALVLIIKGIPHMPTRLNARQISVFSAVMRLGGASAASEFLHISQPAISKTLALMEAELGYVLFRRTGRGLQPTAEALALQPHVERVLSEFDRLQSNAAVIGHGLTGTLSIGGNHTLISRIATVAATGLRSRHPETGLRLLLTPASELIESVAQHRLDVGLIYGPIPTTQVTAEPLCSWPCTCVFPVRDQRLWHRIEGVI